MLKKLLWVGACIVISSCNTIATHSENFAVANINANLAVAYLNNHDSARAKQKLLLAQQQAPHNPAVWSTSGYFLERTGDIAQAQNAYLRAIQLAPRQGAAQNNYGAFLCRQGKYSEAITHFLLAVNDPAYLNTASAYQNAAVCAAKIPDMALANQYAQLARVRRG